MKFIKKYWLILLIALIIFIAIAWYFITKNKVQPPTEPVPPGSPTPTWKPESFPLTLGMYGPKIKALQSSLGIPADGKLGNQTSGAIESAGYSLPLSESDYNKILNSSVDFVGKNAYALVDNVRVSNMDNSVYKFAKKDEWCGKITGKEGDFYLLSGNHKVGTGSVYLK